MKTKNRLHFIVFVFLTFLLFITGASTLKADFIVESENYDSGGMGVGYFDYSGTPDRYAIAGFDALTLVPETGTYRISYIENGEWLKYSLTTTAADAGIYKIYLRAASTIDSNRVRLLNSYNGGTAIEVPGSDISFDRIGTFLTSAFSLWKDIPIGELQLKAGTNKLTLELITGSSDNWRYSINYIKFVKQPIAELSYYSDAADATPDSLLLNYTDYAMFNNWGNGSYNLPTSQAYNVQVLGDVEEAVVNGITDIRGFVWNLRDSSYRYNLDVEIYNSTGTTLLGKMENFAKSTEENPPIVYSSGNLRTLIAAGVFPLISDYHGFTLGKEAILEHAKYRFNIPQGTEVKIKIVPRNDTGSIFDTRNLFGNNTFSGVIPTIPIYDTSVTVDHVDMSQFPRIVVDFTTTGIDNITKLSGSAANGGVNELGEISSGVGNVEVITPKPVQTGGPIDVIVVYENTNSMNNAALQKIQNTIDTITSAGYDVKVKYIPFEIGSANTGIWTNASAAINTAINSFYLPRTPAPSIEPDKWIILAAAANNYNPTTTDVAALSDKMIREKIMFTVVDQDTGNNSANDIETAFYSYKEGLRYYSGHLGVGKTGDYMLDAANLYLLPSAKIKKWQISYVTPLPLRDGAERKERFTVIDNLAREHGPAIAYYRAPRYGAAVQTIVMAKEVIPFDLRAYSFTFTDNIAATSYEAVKYVNAENIASIMTYSYDNERHFQPQVYSGTSTFNNWFNYTGSEDKNFIMINKGNTENSLGIQKTIITNYNSQSSNIYYPTKYTNFTGSITGDNFKWSWNKPSGSVDNKAFYDEKVMIRVVKGAQTTAELERYNVFAKDNIKVPVYANNGSTPDNNLIVDFISNSSRKYIDFIFSENSTVSLNMTNGVMAVYTPQNFSLTGLPMFERYTAQLYTIKNSSDGNTKIVTYESSKEFLVDRPAIDKGTFSTQNDIFALDLIDTQSFPTINAYFTTKTRFQPILSSSNIYLKSLSEMTDVKVDPNVPRTTAASNMEEIKRTITGTVDPAEYLKNIALDTTAVSSSGVALFQYPLDIVFCVDNTGSMQNEIQNTASGLNAFTQSLTNMGFDVKFKLITFGQGSMSNVSGIGNSGENVSYFDRNYLALFNRAWYSKTSGDINNLATRLNAIANSAAGGYADVTGEVGQENGQMAIYYAIQELKNGARSIDKYRNILNDNSGVLPSKKLIIFLTDELMDDGTIPPGCSRSTLMTDLRNMMDIGTEDKINLAGIFHVQNYGTNIDSIMINPLYFNDYGYITQDTTGRAAEAFYDDTASSVSKRYYADFTLAFAEKVKPTSNAQRFRYYEMGTNGSNVAASLNSIAADMGMITRWKLSFTTPNRDTDGTYRDIFYGIKNITGSGTTSVISYLKDVSESEARRYKAPNIVMEVELTTPVSNGQFIFSDTDLTKVIIQGKARAKIRTTENYAMPEYATIRIFDNSNNRLLTNLDYTFKESDRNGTSTWYNFSVEVPVETLIQYGTKLFDVKAAAVKNGVSTETTAEKVTLDAGPPKITKVEVFNETSNNFWKTITKPESTTEKLFDTDILNNSLLSKLIYSYADSLRYSWASPIDITFSSRQTNFSAGKVYDGHYSKQNDKLIITVEFIEENFDMSDLNNGNIKNEIKATLINSAGINSSITITPVAAPVMVDAVIDGLPCKRITAKFETVITSDALNDTAKLKLDIRDKFARSSAEYVDEIDLSIIDNQKPNGAAFGSPSIINAASSQSVSVTKDPYKVQAVGESSIDTNGFRLFKIIYSYDDTKSDFGNTGRQLKIGNHDNDIADGGAKAFYIIAGDGFNINGGTLQGVSLPKTPDINGHGDDGKYTFRGIVSVIDKAGNESMVASASGPVLYVDTQSPRIPYSVLKKVRDRDGLNFPYPDNLVRMGDTAQIQYFVEDFNLASSSTVITNNDLYYKNSTTYPNYSGLLAIGGTLNPAIIVGSSETTDVIKNTQIKIGDQNDVGAIDINGASVNPALIVTSTSTNPNLPIVVGAKDLAGNSASDTLYVNLDNTAPDAPVIAAYAWESTKTGVPGIVYPTDTAAIVKARNNENDPSDTMVHFTYGGNDRNFFIRVPGIANTITANDIKFINTSINDSLGKDVAIENLGEGNSNEFFRISNLTDIVPVENGLNRVKVALRDEAGNISTYSSYATIVMDRMVGDNNTVKNVLGGTAINISGDRYKFTVSIKNIPEYVGLQKLIISKISIAGVSKSVTGIININGTLNTTPVTISAQGEIEFEVPGAMQGMRIQMQTTIIDNLGNRAPFIYEFLVPKRGLQIKSQAEGSQKETRTKVKVVGENQFDLEQTEEAGKTK